MVIPGGFLWQGQIYSSLSTIALRITGTSWSGPRFFGLRDGRDPRPSSGAARGFRSEVQRVYEKRIWTSLPSSLRIAWNGVLKPTFSRCEIGGEDDVLDFLVGQSIDVDLARQPAP